MTMITTIMMTVEDEEPMPRKGKGKGKGRKPRGKRRLAMATAKIIVFAVLIAIYGVYLDQIRSRIDGRSGNCLRRFMAEWSILSRT